jgi:hypothetical protein
VCLTRARACVRAQALEEAQRRERDPAAAAVYGVLAAAFDGDGPDAAQQLHACLAACSDSGACVRVRAWQRRLMHHWRVQGWRCCAACLQRERVRHPTWQHGSAITCCTRMRP